MMNCAYYQRGCLWIGILNVGNIFFPIMHCQVAEVTMNNSVGMQTTYNIQTTYSTYKLCLLIKNEIKNLIFSVT